MMRISTNTKSVRHMYAFWAVFMFTMGSLLLSSCKEDTFNTVNDERQPPVIHISADSKTGSTEAYEGQIVNHTVSLEAQAGIASIQISLNGQVLEALTGISGQVGRDYQIQYLIPEDAEIGSQIVYDFVLVDREGRRVEGTFVIHVIAPPPIPDFEFEDVSVGGNSYKLINLDINMDVTLTAEHDYLLRGQVTVIPEASLFIEAGTTIYSEADASLIIAAGGQLMAEGTAAAPVRFTSLHERTNTANRGDWIGLFIHGFAPVTANHPSIVQNYGPYGGTIKEDNSGSLRFVEIAYAGGEADPSISSGTSRALVNGALNLNGVGNGTVLEHIYVNQSGLSRTGVSISGGDARIKHLFINSPEGRGLLWKAGYSGMIQFLAIVYNDTPGGAYTAIDAYGDSGDAIPTLANVSIQGGGQSDSRGIRMREESSSANAPYTGGAKGHFYNTWITGTGNPGLRTDASSDIIFAHSRIWGIGTPYHNSASAYNTGGAPYFNSSTPISLTQGYRGVDSEGAIDPSTLNSWFSSAAYIGAVNPAADWTAGWVNF